MGIIVYKFDMVVWFNIFEYFDLGVVEIFWVGEYRD